jgi:putative transposase
MRGKKTQISLTGNERKQLTALSHKLNAPYKYVIRAKIILMAARGIPYKEIVVKTDSSSEVVTKWVKRWNETSASEEKNIESRLKDLQRTGSPCKFTAEQKCKIVSLACEKPELYDRPITHWTNGELVNEAIKQGIVQKISPRHVGYILKKTMSSHTG